MTPFDTWFRRPRPVHEPQARLVCFPHAGGTAGFFRSWTAHLPDGIEMLAVQYPGREDRLREPPAADIAAVAGTVADALTPVLDTPVILFGHSLGAAVAYEVALRLVAAGPAAAVRALVVSGRPAPRVDRGGEVHLASDEALCAELRSLDGTPVEVFEIPELRRMVLEIVRADYRLSETYRPGPSRPLPCPVLACLAADDPEVTITEARAWASTTAAGFACQVFPGNHFYLAQQGAEVLAGLLRFALATPPAVARDPVSG